MTVGALDGPVGPDVVPSEVVPPEVVTTPDGLPVPVIGCGGLAGSPARGTAAMLNAAPSATI